jgi:hypothetical protein
VSASPQHRRELIDSPHRAARDTTPAARATTAKSPAPRRPHLHNTAPSSLNATALIRCIDIRARCQHTHQPDNVARAHPDEAASKKHRHLPADDAPRRSRFAEADQIRRENGMARADDSLDLAPNGGVGRLPLRVKVDRGRMPAAV